MRVTLIGHACVFVEAEGTRCLMDPVFGDPFEEGAVTTCPRREVDASNMPRPDVVILSHAHLDHFDIPTLATLPRDADVLCPKDKVILYALEQLGFRKIHATDPMARIDFKSHTPLTTHSNVTNVVEFGVVFKDRSGTFWNQVDTVIAPATVTTTLAQCGKIDLLFAMHASQNFEFFESLRTGFPYAMHEMNLRTALSIRPRMAVPGAAGFRFCGPFDWCNAFLFPMSREQFVRDLRKLEPSIDTRIANPGDVFEIEGGEIEHRSQASPFARLVDEDTYRLRYDPTATVPPLVDVNPDGHTRERLERDVEECMRAFGELVANRTDDDVLRDYRASGASYAVGVVFPDGAEWLHRVDFTAAEPRLSRADATKDTATVVHRIAASAVVSWLARDKSYFYLRAFSRRSSALYALSGAGTSARVEPKVLPDLFERFLRRHVKGAELTPDGANGDERCQ